MTIKKKIFFDTEFTGLHQKTTLISIGLISECGKTFYAELFDYDELQIDEWIKTNVIENLILKEDPWTTIEDKKTGDIQHFGDIDSLHIELIKWLDQFGEIEMWSDCLTYDWMLFNQIFGHAFNIPENVYYIPFDICTSFREKGIDPDISREEFVGEITIPRKFKKIKHNAMWDAFIIRECHNKLNNIK
jgi:hypothetical protein